MGLSIVLFAAGVGMVVFVIRRCDDPFDWIDTVLNIALIVIAVLLIGTSFAIYPIDEPFGGAPYPTNPPSTINHITPTTTISLSATSTWRD